MSKKTAEITAAATTKVIEDGKLTSLTQVSKVLGLGKGSVRLELPRQFVTNLKKMSV